MPAKSHNTHFPTALDTEICHKIIKLEHDIYEYSDNVMPKKRKYSLVANVELRILATRDLVVAGMDYDINIYPAKKHELLSDARANLRNLSVDLQQLNDLGLVSNAAKATFDIQIDDVQTNLAKLLSSLLKKIDIASQS